MRAWAIVAAAGRGERLGGTEPKAFRLLAGVPMIAMVVAALGKAPGIEGIVLVVPAGFEARAAELASPVALRVVAGGDSRTESVRRGLAAVPSDAEAVLVHDAARPLVTAELAERVLVCLASAPAAICAVMLSDTVKRVEGESVTGTLDREGLWRAQTPQAFRAGLLRQAHERAAAEGFEGTDDAALVERIGARVAVVSGDERNLKITTVGDLEIAEALAATGGSR